MIKIVNISFNSPVYLWLFVGVFFIIITNYVNVGWSRRKGVMFANYRLIEQVARTKIVPRSSFQFFIKLIIFSLLILALADMVIWYEGFGLNSDIILAIDSSASMLADDFIPSRLEAAKDVAIGLISDTDISTKIGVISFAGTTIINEPLTSDKISLRDSVEKIDVIKTGGTAIGEAILLGTNMLSVSSIGKILILITDGQNNVGISTNDAVTYANNNGVIISTIGIGSEEGGKFAEGRAVSQLDRTSLMGIAKESGGKFYSAGNSEELEIALRDIFSSEKRKIGLHARVHLLLVAVILFFIEWVLANTRYRITP